jgi:hypothetical protein
MMKAHSLDSFNISGEIIISKCGANYLFFQFWLSWVSEGRENMQVKHRRVRFETCISLIFLTRHQMSEPVELGPTQWAGWASLPYCLVTFLLGWWGIPWGIFLTPVVIWRNLRGGQELLEDNQPVHSGPSDMFPSDRMSARLTK